MTRFDQGTGRLSLRNSILVWVAGIVIGWGCAVVLFYQLIRDSGAEGGLTASDTMIAEADDATGLSEITPAAGPAAAQADKTVGRKEVAQPASPAIEQQTKPVPTSEFGRIEVETVTE